MEKNIIIPLRYGLAFITNQKLKKQDLQAAEK